MRVLCCLLRVTHISLIKICFDIVFILSPHIYVKFCYIGHRDNRSQWAMRCSDCMICLHVLAWLCAREQWFSWVTFQTTCTKEDCIWGNGNTPHHTRYGWGQRVFWGVSFFLTSQTGDCRWMYCGCKQCQVWCWSACQLWVGCTTKSDHWHNESGKACVQRKWGDQLLVIAVPEIRIGYQQGSCGYAWWWCLHDSAWCRIWRDMYAPFVFASRWQGDERMEWQHNHHHGAIDQTASQGQETEFWKA